MKFFLLFVFLFLVGSFFGWCLEVFFRRFFSAKKWVNPGFMRGPWLPLYGFGVTVMFTIIIVLQKNLPIDIPLYNPSGFYNFRGESSPTVYDLIPISIMGASMILLEFVAGLIFVKGFKVRLWDYSNMKGNIMGIICPVFNVIWVALAIIFYYGINPFVYDIANKAYVYMFGQSLNSPVTEAGNVAHFGFIFVLGLVYGVMLVDLIKSIDLFNKITKFAKESGLVTRYDEMRLKQKELTKEAKQKLVSVLPETVKKTLEESKKITTNNEVVEKAKATISKMILIDPNKSTSSNYDENGRPISIDEKKKK